MKKLSNISIITIITLLTACGSGQKSSTNPSLSAPAGPVSYAKINSATSTSNPNVCSTNPTAAEFLKLSNRYESVQIGGCGTIMNSVGSITGLFSFLPEIGPLLGPLGLALQLMGMNLGSACMEKQIIEINQELATQESQIQNIYSILALDQNDFYKQNYKTAAAINGLQEQNYSAAVNSIVGTQGINLGMFGNFMIILNLWLPNTGTPTVNPAVASNSNYINSISTNSNILTQAEAAIVGQQTSFQAYLLNVGGISRSSCSNNCYLNVSANPQSALMLTLGSLYSTLQANITLAQNQQQDLVPLLDQYNNTIASIFQQSLYAINDAFQMEY